MAKTSPRPKRSVAAKTSRKRVAAKKTGTRKATVAKSKKTPKKEGVSEAAIERTRRLEKRDAAPPRAEKKKGTLRKALDKIQAAVSLSSSTNSGFPKTYIRQVNISLTDPMHAMTLTWTGPNAAGQPTGPYHTSPGAGLRGLNCDNAVTSRRSGTRCTPKGTFTVQSFARRLNSDSRATHVTFFVQARGIALHYFPIVPNVPASHGCVRIQDESVARLIHDNARTGLTKVVVDGTWTKPPKQW
jgi:hypothetical protein